MTRDLEKSERGLGLYMTWNGFGVRKESQLIHDLSGFGVRKKSRLIHDVEWLWGQKGI